jgi:hypothetical protein
LIAPSMMNGFSELKTDENFPRYHIGPVNTKITKK